MTYQYFNNSLKYLYNNCKAIFHSETEDDFKKHMHKEFKDTIDWFRFLIAPVACCMGVDCKGLNLVLQCGTAASIADNYL